jgi:hypothetical protein
MDIIGKIYKIVGDEFATELPGFHVNTPEPVAAWADKQVFPKTPSRVYGGHETFYYVFSNEAEFISSNEELAANAD